MPDITFMSGLPGGGKSTLIDQEGGDYQLICPDDLRLAWGHVYHQPLEPMVHAVCGAITRAAMLRGRDIVVDECFTKLERLQPFLEMAKEFGYETRIVVLTTPVDVCIQRCLDRNDGHPWEDIIYKKAMQFVTDWPVIVREFNAPEDVLGWPYTPDTLVEDIEYTYELF